MLYQLKVRALKTRYGSAIARRLAARNGQSTRSAIDYIEAYAPGRSFVDVGGMYGIHGEHSFRAEEAGATRVQLVDMFKTPEFDQKKAARDSSVEFVMGDVTDPRVIQQLGVVDVVWCFGVLYHVPNPHQLVAGLRAICGGVLILETLTIPEMRAVPNAAVYFPMQGEAGRKLWDTRLTRASVQHGIATEFRPELGYANNFWALSPSAVRSLLRTAGFEVEEWGPSQHGVLRHVFRCRAT